MCHMELFCWCCDILEHDLNTWTDRAVETCDHVNLMDFFAISVRNMFLDFSFEIRSVARYLSVSLMES